MSIPADFRRVLDECDPSRPAGKTTRMYVLYGAYLNGCLHAYTPEAMDDMVRLIAKLPRGSAKRKNASRFILGKSQEIEIDKDGRIVLPKERREQLGLGDTGGMLTMVGMGEYFEIWSKDKYDALEASMDEDFMNGVEDDDTGFDPMALLPFDDGG